MPLQRTALQCKLTGDRSPEACTSMGKKVMVKDYDLLPPPLILVRWRHVAHVISTKFLKSFSMLQWRMLARTNIWCRNRSSWSD